MTLERRAKMLAVESAAYVAGLIDGEGTITLTRLHAHENRRLVVSIASTEIQLLEFVVQQFGAGKITRKKVTSDRHSPSYCYAVTSRQALALLAQITPFLRSYKQKRAELALRQYLAVTPRNGKYTTVLLDKRRHFEREFLALEANSNDPRRSIDGFNR